MQLKNMFEQSLVESLALEPVRVTEWETYKYILGWLKFSKETSFFFFF